VNIITPCCRHLFYCIVFEQINDDDDDDDDDISSSSFCTAANTRTLRSYFLFAWSWLEFGHQSSWPKKFYPARTIDCYKPRHPTSFWLDYVLQNHIWWIAVINVDRNQLIQYAKAPALLWVIVTNCLLSSLVVQMFAVCCLLLGSAPPLLRFELWAPCC